MSAFLRKRTSVHLLFHPPARPAPSLRRVRLRSICTPSPPFPLSSRTCFPRPSPACHAKPSSSSLSPPPESQTPSTSRLRSPYDLVNFRRSRFVAHLNELSHRPIPSRDAPTRLDRALSAAGIAHESRVIAYLQTLLSQTLSLSAPETLYTVPPVPSRYRLTRDAIRRRVPLIRAAALQDDVFAGVADVLLLARADPFATPAQRARAAEGEYVVCEVKLASTCTADYALQAAAYVSMLRKMERSGVEPETGAGADWAYVWTGSPDKPPTQISLVALMYLLERTKRDFDVFLKEFDASAQVLPDVPVEMLSPWKGYALEILQEKDDLRLIAGIRRSQVNQIESVFGVATLTDFAELSDRDVEEVVRKHSLHSTYRTLHRQASMQLQTRKNGGKCTAYELVEGASSLLLPPDSNADMFFDMEGFPLMKGGGLEYLFGLDVGMDGDFKFWWAHNRQEEEQAFVWLVRCICDLVEKEQAAGRPKPHVYHYGHYEVTALRRVALRAKTAAGHAARNTLDKLFEDGMFIDVFNIISSSIVVGEPSYSIKKIEKLVNISREDDELADAESSVGMYYEWRRKHFHEDDSGQQEIVDDITSPILEEILVYNRQDCRSLRDVVSWLRAVLPHVDKLTFVDAQDDPPSESDSLAASDGDANVIEQGACGPTMKHKLADSIAIRRCLELSSSLVALGSSELDAETRGIVAHLLMYHTRESLPSRKQFSNMIKQASESDYRDLFDDDQCISGISWKGRKADMETNKQYFEYTFPRAQLFKLTSGNSAAFVVPKVGPKNISGDESKSDISCFVSLKEVSYSKENSPGSLILSAGRNPDYEPPKFGVLVSSEDLKVCNAPLRQSILLTTEKLTKQKADASVALPLAFIERRPIDEEPSRDISLEKMRNRQTRSENVAEFLASRKLSCVFVIQGPPGSGKTSLSGEIIQQLVMTYGKTVAVSSNSHAAIDNLLSSAVRSGCEAQTVWKVGTRCTKPNVARFKANVRDVKIVSWLAESEESDQCTSPSSTDHASSKRTKAKATGALVGATCYQLSQECIDGAFDFLFVDEASQVPIPNFLSMSTAAKYAILVGDQQQLEMPIRGTHPEILEQSCLAYTVGEGVKTVPASRGIFLDVSYRMNPALCQFVSQHFYDHTLAHASICTENKLNLGSNNSPDCFQYGSHGISFISTHEIPCVAEVLAPTPSYGKWYQPIEVFVISQIVSQILGLSCTVNGTSKTIGASDILVVAPYNAQVRALKDALPQGIRVGTVDKFQGQEAPVTVLSTCTSESSEDWDRYKYNGDHGTDKNGWQNGVAMSFSSDSMPGNKERRGFCFALQKNRLNVAISRAQCLAVVVGDAHAFSRIPLITLGDVDVASLYESIVSVQSK